MLVNMSRAPTDICHNCGSRTCKPFARSAPSSTTKSVPPHRVKGSAVDLLSSIRSRTAEKIDRMRAKSDPVNMATRDLKNPNMRKLDPSKLPLNVGSSNLSASLPAHNSGPPEDSPSDRRGDGMLVNGAIRYKRRSRGSSWSSRPEIASLASIDDGESSVDEMPVQRTATTPSRRIARSAPRLLRGRNAVTFDDRTSPLPPHMHSARRKPQANPPAQPSNQSLPPDGAGVVSTSIPPTIQFTSHDETSTPSHEACSFWQPSVYPAAPEECPISVLAMRPRSVPSADDGAASKAIAIPNRPTTSAFLPLLQ